MLNIDKEMSKAYSDNGAFFAFSKKQFDEKALPDVKYARMQSGLICPKANAKKLNEQMSRILDEGAKKVLETNTKREIIWYELTNHECQITYDYSDAVNAVRIYNITEEEIKEVWPDFLQHCQRNDLF